MKASNVVNQYFQSKSENLEKGVDERENRGEFFLLDSIEKGKVLIKINSILSP